jgi:hypothetical protein
MDVQIINDEIPYNPLIEIGNVAPSYNGFAKGGSISVEIKNNGNADATNVHWNISITGGLLGMINVQDLGTIPTLGIGKSVIVQTVTPIHGLGKVKITIHADQAERTIDGFIIGPFIILR